MIDDEDKKSDDIEPEEEIIMEEENGSFGVSAKEKKLKEKLKICEKEKKEYLDGWQRSKAEFVNIRKEDEKRNNEFKKFAISEVIYDVLSIMDSFDLAMSNDNWKKLDKTWQDGIKSLHTQFINILKKYNVEPIKAAGEKFNLQEHESIAEIEVDKKSEDGIVAVEMRKGYKMHDKILRPAQVKVAKLKT